MKVQTYQSRLAVINIMLDAMGKSRIEWDDFEKLGWDEVEEITELYRQEYNESLNWNGSEAEVCDDCDTVKSKGHIAFSKSGKFEFLRIGDYIYRAHLDSAFSSEGHRHSRFESTLASWKTFGEVIINRS